MSAPTTPAGGPRTVVEVLRAAAAHHGDVEAYVEPAGGGPGGVLRRWLSFAGWDRAADGAAGLFSSLGASRGDVVCLLLPSSIDYAVAYAGAMRLGAVTSGVNVRLGPSTTAAIVERSHPAVTVWDPAVVDAVPPGAGRVIAVGEIAGSGEGRPPPHLPVLHENDPVAVVWTSGTTGRPKGAVFDHANLAAVAAGTDVLSRPGDRRLSPLPFPHVGYMTRAWDEIVHAVTTVITPSPWRATEALRIMETERITVGQGVPTQWALVLALPELEGADLSSLRIAATGAGPVPPELVAEMRRRLGVPVVVRYTSTETSLGTGTAPQDPDEVVAATVGRPVPGVELCVTGPDGEPVPAGEVGRVRIRSGAAIRGYWADAPAPRREAGGWADLIDAEATAAVRTDSGWTVTGDYGSIDDAGNLVLAGRADELYIRGGYNVYPAEVEGVIGGHPAVARVAVVGTPDAVLGEVGVAFVVPPPDDPPALGELRALVAERLADYKAPDVLVVVEALPLTAMMKVDKRALAPAAASAASGRLSGAASPPTVMVDVPMDQEDR